jgi:hypothetical protein
MRPATRDEVHPGTAVKVVSSQGFRSAKPVFMQETCLHDQGEMFALIAQQRKVFQGIAVDDDGIGKCARL